VGDGVHRPERRRIAGACVSTSGRRSGADGAGERTDLSHSSGPRLSESANPGVFIYVDKEHAATISFALRLREWSQPADFVELPIVRERDFFSTTTQLLEVPTSNATRVHLRLYGSSSPNGRGDVIVRIFSADNTKLFEQPLSLTPAGGLAAIPGPTAFSENPAYAELPNLTANFAGRGNVRVEIEPVTAGLRYWSFISVTNNATQRVSLITPQ
jgi:hypothetical protein